MNFSEAVSYLLALGHETLAIKLGLEKTKTLLASLGNPQQSFLKIQIAGTNGKGSTAAFLDSICRAAGLRTGLYTSPHLASITERIKIDGQEIEREKFSWAISVVQDSAARLLDRGLIDNLPTFFEHITAAAICAFADAEIDIGILETGLGGRLDSTTATAAEVVAITPIALDHQEYLGETLAEIASEKAAVIKSGVAAIVAPQPPEALDAILRRCTEVGTRPVLLDDRQWKEIAATTDGRIQVAFDVCAEHVEGVLLSLRGRHQVVNAATAIAIALALREQGLEIPNGALVKGLRTAQHPGRLELIEGSPTILLDGAHNPDGARALAAYLREFGSKSITLVFGAMRDKETGSMFKQLAPLASRIVLTGIENPRAESISRLSELLNEQGSTAEVYTSDSSLNAVVKARDVTPQDGIICIAGSLYLIGEVRPSLIEQLKRVAETTSTEPHERTRRTVY